MSTLLIKNTAEPGTLRNMENNATSPMPTLAQFLRFCGFAQQERGGNGGAQLTLINQARDGGEKLRRIAHLSAEECGPHAERLRLPHVGLSRDGQQRPSRFLRGHGARGSFPTHGIEDQILLVNLILYTGLCVVDDHVCAK